MNFRPAWSTKQVPEQLGLLLRETLSQQKGIKDITLELSCAFMIGPLPLHNYILLRGHICILHYGVGEKSSTVKPWDPLPSTEMLHPALK